MKNKILLAVAIVVILLLVAFLWLKNVNKQAAIEIQDLTSREVALRCTTDMATQFHIHPQLRIYVDGREVFIPDDTGIAADCMRAIHTHKDRPELHVEAPIQKDFTLGDFFAVWGKDFSRSKLLDNVVNDGSSITVTVNGEKVDTYENTILKDKDKIVISFQNFEGEADPARMSLGMQTWTWIRTTYSDGKEIKPLAEKKFTITFRDDKTFSATTDCNEVGGKYVAKDNKITFGEMASTLMYCEGSQESDFTKSLSEAQSYLFTSRGELILDLKFDSGSVVFR